MAKKTPIESNDSTTRWMTSDEIRKAIDDAVDLSKRDVVVGKQFVSKLEETNVSRQIRVIISDGSVDRDNDTIDIAGWELSAYKMNPVVLWAHDHKSLPVAKAVSVGIEGSKLVAVMEFATHAFAETVYQLYRGGFMRAFSVGFKALEYAINEQRGGIDFKRMELLEFSTVPVPANAMALVAAESNGIDLSTVKSWIDDSIAAWPNDTKPTWKSKSSPRIVSEVRVDSKEFVEDIRLVGESVVASIERATSDAVAKIDAAKSKAVTTVMKIGAKPIAKIEGLAELVAEKDTVRWNRSLSKAFDVATETFTPQSVEQALAAKYCGCEIKRLHHTVRRIPSTKLGAYLTALDEALTRTVIDDVRNLDYEGKEAPPLYECIQLNSKQSTEFLVDGMRFLDLNETHFVIRVEPRYYGLEVTSYSATDVRNVADEFLAGVVRRAAEFKFLKGESFTLSGEFLARGSESLEDLMLDSKNAEAVGRIIALVNDKGAAIENRGVLMVGPPGCGKTLSTRILMNSCDTTFVSISARDFYYLGGGFSALSEMFDVARENAPCICAIEDVDSHLTGTVVDLLKTEMDGVAQSRGVVTLLSSNYPELLPKALIDRPGRFHDVLRFNLPNDEQRTRMIERWMPELSADEVGAAVKETEGYSGAHIRELARFASIIRDQDGLGPSEALVRALAKLAEQRDLITSVQSSGTRYRAPEFVTAKSEEPVVEAPKTDDVAIELSDEGQDDATLEIRADDEPAVELTDDPKAYQSAVERASYRDAMRSAIREMLPAIVRDVARDATTITINQIRGRLD